MADGSVLHVEECQGQWALVGPGAEGFGEINQYLAYLLDRGYSPRTVRAYAFDLLDFGRWLIGQTLTIGDATTDILLRYLARRLQNRPAAIIA